ncbi:MAG TPA: hypothetical protein DCE41_16270 [Cytophagales bacterium]|nr:hypothetical protein [Cytophagales bacterium]HAA19462.1 hypothetical protein [Cytophagales bacterium]HAP58678.1 hypothetical protein [Cytophagales bacterium]
MKPIETPFSTIFIGFEQAYIYVWVSLEYKFMYVGMTNSRVGTLGRANQHLDMRGTLRERFLMEFGLDIDTVSDLRLYSFPLPKSYLFFSVESTYREAVEYLVQKQLLEMISQLSVKYSIISRVRSNERTRNSRIRNLANEIIIQLIKNLPQPNETDQRLIGRIS